MSASPHMVACEHHMPTVLELAEALLVHARHDSVDHPERDDEVDALAIQLHSIQQDLFASRLQSVNHA